MKKRILVVSPGVLPLPPVLGGAVENMIWRLDQHLKEQFDLEYVSVSMGDETNSSVDSSRIHYIQSINPLKDFSKENNFELMESSKWIEYEQFVSALVASGNYDVVHVHNEAGLTSAIYRSSPNTKIILHINDEVMSKMSRKQLREIAEVQPLVLACSRLVEANISAAFHHAHVPMPAHDLFYNFVDPDEFNPGRFSQQERIEYLENLGLDPKKITVLFAGRLIEQKGAHLALDAFSKAGEELQMLFVGAPWYSRKADSSYCSRLESQCEQFNGKVKFTGYVNHTDMPKIYSLADIFLAPSIWDDPSPFVTYEAQAMELPVIAGSRGGIPEIVKDGVTGYCIDPFNTSLFARLLRELCDDSLRSLLGRNGRQRIVRNFSLSSAALRMANIYESL